MDNQNITEKLDPRKNDIGDYIEDFMQSDAPQFKGKSKDKIKDMAIAAYYNDRKEAGLKEDTDIIFEGLSEVNLSKYKDTELKKISVAFSDAGVNWSSDKLFKPAIISLGKELAKRKMPIPPAVKAVFKPAELKKILGESTLNWARSMRAIQKQQKMANISPKDKDTLRKIADLMKRANEEVDEEKEMDPTKHVSKKGDGYIVVNKDGKVVKNFDNKDDADKYAIDNHDELMESVELEEAPTPTFMERVKALNEAKKKAEMDEEDQEEGNAFGAAVMAAKKKGDKEFIFAGKKYMVKEYVGVALTPANQIAKKHGGKVKTIMAKDEKGKRVKHFYVEEDISEGKFPHGKPILKGKGGYAVLVGQDVVGMFAKKPTSQEVKAISKKLRGVGQLKIVKTNKDQLPGTYFQEDISEVKEPFAVVHNGEVLGTYSKEPMQSRIKALARDNKVDSSKLKVVKTKKNQSVGSTLKESDITELYEETHSVKIKVLYGKNTPLLHVQKMTGLKIKKGTVNKFGSDLGMSLEGPLAKVRKFITRIKTGRYQGIIQLVDQEPKKESSARSRNPINVIGKVAGKDFQSKIMRMYGDKKLNDAIPFFFMLDTGASKKDAAKLVNTIRDKNLRKDIQDYLSTVKEETETHYEWDLDEAKKLPFKSLEQAWQRTKGDKDKQAKLIKKHSLKNVISNVRPGEIRLGAKNKLQGSKANMTIAGLDKENNLIFVSNNPLKIFYPKKSQRRPEGIEATPVYESMQDLRIKAIVQELTGADSETLQLFLAHNTFTEESSYTDIKKAYRSFINEIL